MKLCIVGSGYVGLVTGVCFADLGNKVYCIDKDKNKINDLKKGFVPIFEPGLEELTNKNLKSGRLIFSTNLKNSILKSDIIFICVGTPINKSDNSANLKYVFQAIKEIRKYINKFKIIITKSTVPIATGDKIEMLIKQKVSKKFFNVVSNPEFLREGEAIRDFMFPERIVVGSRNTKVNRILSTL